MSPARSPREEGDALYARRAVGARGIAAKAATVDAARERYRAALAADPDDLASAASFLRATWFRATYGGGSDAQRLRLYEEARAVGDDALARLEGALGPLAQAGKSWRRRAGAGDLVYWAAAVAGEWGLVKGKLAAARAGVAARVRDLATALLAFAPDVEAGGADRILGRLHAEAPRVPLVTGWISRTDAITHLRRARERGPREVVTLVFLAEALLDHGGEKGRVEAIHLLEEAAGRAPRPEMRLEDADYIQRARARLQALG